MEDAALRRVRALSNGDWSDAVEDEISALLPPLIDAGYVSTEGESDTGFLWRFTQEGIVRKDELGRSAFVEAAEAFMHVVDLLDRYSRDDFVRDLENVLVDLYAAGVGLDNLEPNDDAEPRDGLTAEEGFALRSRLAETLGDYDLYEVVFDPYDRNSAPVTSSLADDVAEIYGDLQEGFAELRAGQTANALWDWKFGFDYHWGRHAAHAIHALYNLRARLSG